MKITYVVTKNHLLRGSVSVLESHSFSKVRAAINFHKKQNDGYFDWWQIEVIYSKNESDEN